MSHKLVLQTMHMGGQPREPLSATAGKVKNLGRYLALACVFCVAYLRYNKGVPKSVEQIGKLTKGGTS